MTKEMWEKAKAAKSAEELLAFAKEHNIELTAEQAKAVFDKLHTGELPDDDLESVAGGAATDEEWYIPITSEKCDPKNNWLSGEYKC